MNSFENVCPDCPLRTKVNLPFATEMHSMGSDGVNALLKDGANAYNVTVTPYSVTDSYQSNDAWQALNKRVEACNGPTAGLLRKKCAAGLACVWRWLQMEGQEKIDLDTPDKIRGSIMPSSAEEALSSTLTESTYIVGDAEDFVGLSFRSPYTRYGYHKINRKLRGPATQLKKGSVFALDGVLFNKPDSVGKDQKLFNLSFFNGPSFHFIGNDKEYDKDPESFLAQAISKLLSATPEELEQSAAFADEVWKKHQESEKRMREFLDSDRFWQGFKKSKDKDDEWLR